METRDYRKQNLTLRTSISKRIANDKNSINCYLYRADNAILEGSPIEDDVVGNVEHRERVPDYSDPVETKILFLPYEFDKLKGYLDGTSSLEGQTADGATTEVKALILDEDVPMQSIIQFDEVTDSDSGAERRQITLYVGGFENVGLSPTICTHYVLVPMQTGGEGL